MSTQPAAADKPYAVRALDGGTPHHFATLIAATLYAATQVRQSWAGQAWTVTTATPGERILVDVKGQIVNHLVNGHPVTGGSLVNA